jgi:hypothetical protein
MPWYVILYLLVLAAVAVASWQIADRMSQLVPAWLRNGELLAAAGQILATCAYWNDGLRGSLGVLAVPLVAALVGWMVFAIGPAVETTRALVAASGGSPRRAMIHVYAGMAVAFALAAPALFFGLRVALAALGS